MSTSLQSAVKLGLTGNLTQTTALGTAGYSLTYAQNATLSPGAGAGQANLLYQNTITLAASGTQTLNLSTLTDPFGNSIGFTKVRALVVYAYPANTNNVLVGNAASNAWFSWCDAATDAVTVRPGGYMCLYANDATAYAVTPSTAMNLLLTNSSSGTGVTFDIIIIGS